MINFDDHANENKKEYNSKWPYIPDHPYRVQVIEVSVSGKTSALNLIHNQQVLIKYICMQKIHMKQNINF